MTAFALRTECGDKDERDSVTDMTAYTQSVLRAGSNHFFRRDYVRLHYGQQRGNEDP